MRHAEASDRTGGHSAASTGRSIPVAGPWMSERERAYVVEAIDLMEKGGGSFVRRFESAFAGHIGRNYALALPSCTAGLHLALAGLGIGRGDEVIVPDITWIATAAPITYVGATPVFADIDPDTWCITPGSFIANATERTKAVIVVDLYGSMPDMDALLPAARERNVDVIEDAAEAIGSEYRGRKAGSFGVSSVFSFHGSKTLATGEGGMVLTDDTHLFERMRVLRDHGREPEDKSFYNREIGYKYRMSDLQAAVGLGQLERIDELVARKRQIFAWYEARLRDLPGVHLNCEPAGTQNAYWMVTATFDTRSGLRGEYVRRALTTAGIDSRPFFHPLSSLPAFDHFASAHAARARNAVSYDLSPRGINLPSGLKLCEDDVDRVCAQLRGLIGVAA